MTEQPASGEKPAMHISRDPVRSSSDESYADEESPLHLNDSQLQPCSPSRNEFSTRKTAAHALMDVALMMANISQLRTLLAADKDNKPFFWPLLVLIALSLLCQITFAFLVIILWSRQMNPPRRRSSSASSSSMLSSKKLACMESKLSSLVASKRPLRRSNSDTFVQPFTVVVPMTNFSKSKKDDDDDNDDDDDDGDDDNSYKVTNRRLQSATVVIVFCITVFNMFITGLGVDPGHVTKT
ncbi:uncharacterized protein LOC112572428 [Pomacea canaliculata]|uniref:uncharacterized protein LOC112572428 n=1 Tax=Pomacea canaliculata TaxID=400727 RepID=UPI000D737861|nr:uncharacterized protein LOC112572428 [Pomacea canaliculata]